MNKLFGFLLIIIAGVNGLAQELSVDSFEKTLDPMTVSIQRQKLYQYILEEFNYPIVLTFH